MTLKPTDRFAEIERHLAELKAMPLAKCEPLDPLEESRRNYHAAWTTALDVQVRQPGWSLRKVAERIGVHVSMVCKWRDHGWRKDSQIPGHIELRLPRLMSDVLERELCAFRAPLSEASNG